MPTDQLSRMLHGWHDYYLLAGTAAATLLGLLFIAVTLNADLILAGDRPHLKRVAEQAFQNYIAVLLSSFLFLVEGAGPRVLGFQVLIIGAIAGTWSVLRIRSALRVTDASFNRARMLRRLIPSVFGYALMLFAGFQMRSGEVIDGLALFAAAHLILLVSLPRPHHGTCWCGWPKSGIFERPSGRSG